MLFGALKPRIPTLRQHKFHIYVLQILKQIVMRRL